MFSGSSEFFKILTRSVRHNLQCFAPLTYGLVFSNIVDEIEYEIASSVSCLTCLASDVIYLGMVKAFLSLSLASSLMGELLLLLDVSLAMIMIVFLPRQMLLLLRLLPLWPLLLTVAMEMLM